ncbi:MAG: Asp-tRNA(Asn)/Glu-tRNA(Gln) amidotransferase subunit GatA, partial [Nocardiaceae bacterium]|nr:Asp-tRNA(Asn)/Glu-tRNA(Gln) amidotransferase subunit GatA [Nocardiaceae bacterium]
MSTDLTRLDASELASKIHSREVSSVEVTQAHLDRIGKVDGELHAFLHVAGEQALVAAKEVDSAIAAGDKPVSALAGVPIALKDVFTTTDMPTTCASKILENWVSPYDATLTTKLREAGIPILGKTNMDEFAMGSSTENSAYGPTRNPWDTTRIPGGSGGGSAAALASYEAPLAIGTDTGGSIRQPAAVTATVGTKPTYGTVSRFGLVACASSLDQGGPCGRTVLDTALLHEVIAGYDPRDSTSVNEPVRPVVEAARQGASGDLKGVRVGVVKELHSESYQPGVIASFDAAVEQLTALGAEVVEVSCPNFLHALAAYYLILPSEVSSNLARFDAMRYGLRVDDGNMSAEQVMAATRAAGFGKEVKRRIMIGTYALSSGYYDAYYGSALKVRTLIARDFDAAYEKVDVLVSPTSPFTPWKLGEKVNDPLAMYLSDLCTLPTNLAGHCAMSVPSGV